MTRVVMEHVEYELNVPETGVQPDSLTFVEIDQEKCIKCGKCAASCPYHAIVMIERPCQAACGMDAIGVDEYGKARIDYDRCVACGQWPCQLRPYAMRSAKPLACLSEL